MVRSGHRRELDPPFPFFVCLRLEVLTAHGDSHVRSRIGPSPDRIFNAPLQDHVIADHGRELEPGPGIGDEKSNREGGGKQSDSIHAAGCNEIIAGVQPDFSTLSRSHPGERARGRLERAIFMLFRPLDPSDGIQEQGAGEGVVRPQFDETLIDRDFRYGIVAG